MVARKTSVEKALDSIQTNLRMKRWPQEVINAADEWRPPWRSGDKKNVYSFSDLILSLIPQTLHNRQERTQQEDHFSDRLNCRQRRQRLQQRQDADRKQQDGRLFLRERGVPSRPYFPWSRGQQEL